MYEYLQEKGTKFPILYVEDNDGLREKALRFFKKFFTTVYVGKDGEDGFELYKKHQPKIVICDIQMPKLTGLEMAKKIKLIDPNVKIIITTAFDDKEFLIKAIELGIFRYINKPFNIQEITYILTKSLEEIEHQIKLDIFNQNIHDIFNHQDNLLVLIEDNKPTIANYNFLQFFALKDLSEFSSKFGNFYNIFQEHKDFFYGKNTIKQIKENPNSLFNVKLKKDNNFYHFIFKIKKLPNKENQYIYSFSDITELGLLKTFSQDEYNEKNIKSLLETIKNNKAQLKIHNYYKELSITNDTEIIHIDENFIELKVNYLQSKAIQYEKQFVLSSPFLPKSILCQNITNMSYSDQSITASKYKFVEHTPINRKYTRVMPENFHKAILFYDFERYPVKIRDMSIKSVRFRINKLPPGIKLNEVVKIDVILGKNEEEFLIQSTSKVFRIDKVRDDLFDIVITLSIKDETEKSLVDYISKRQIALIREFKNLDKEHIVE